MYIIDVYIIDVYIMTPRSSLTWWASDCVRTELRSPPAGCCLAISSSFWMAHSISSVSVFRSWFHWAAFVSRRLLYPPKVNTQQSVRDSQRYMDRNNAAMASTPPISTALSCTVHILGYITNNHNSSRQYEQNLYITGIYSWYICDWK